MGIFTETPSIWEYILPDFLASRTCSNKSTPWMMPVTSGTQEKCATEGCWETTRQGRSAERAMVSSWREPAHGFDNE